MSQVITPSHRRKSPPPRSAACSRASGTGPCPRAAKPSRSRWRAEEGSAGEHRRHCQATCHSRPCRWGRRIGWPSNAEPKAFGDWPEVVPEFPQAPWPGKLQHVFGTDTRKQPFAAGDSRTCTKGPRPAFPLVRGTFPVGGRSRIRTWVGVSRRIYSPLPLAARAICRCLPPRRSRCVGRSEE